MNINLKISCVRLGRYAIAKFATGFMLVSQKLHSIVAQLKNNEDSLIVLRDAASSLSEAKSILELKKYHSKKKSILLIELNEFHGASLVCNGLNFEKIGYEVCYLIAWGQMIYDNPFFSLKKRPNLFTGTLYDIQQYLHDSERLKQQFDLVFFNTSFDWRGNSIFELIGRVPTGRFGFLMVEHNPIPNIKKLHEEYFQKRGLLLHLSGFQNLPLLASTTNGLIAKKKKNQKVIRFSIVGAMSKKNRNFDQLTYSIRKLIQEGIVNFFVHVVGPGIGSFPPDILPFIRFHGRLDYPSLYEVVGRSDYLLTLMDYEIEEHRKYIDNWSTGTSHLSYTTLTPVLIQKPFAASYGYDFSNSIIYDVDSENCNDNLFQAMRFAIKLDSEDYEKMVESLQKLVKTLDEKTTIELSSQIKRLEAQC